MLAENLSETFTARRHGDGKSSRSDAIRMAFCLLGGILVFNSWLATKYFASAIDAEAAQLSAAIGAIILSAPIFVSAVRDLLRGKVYMNELVTLALIAAFSAGDYITAGAVAFFMVITIAIEHRTAVGAEASIESLIRLTPRRARRLADGAEEDVDVLDLKVGDICRVRPGENLPADGVVVSGTSSINQASITGESLPADKGEKDEVYAGTTNLTGLIDIRVTRVGTDTTLGKVKDLILAAEHSKTPVMRMIDRYVGYYTPTILMVAAMVFFFTRDLNRVIAVLVMSCPCALVLATPSAIIAAIASASRLGILIKDVAHIELAAKIRAVVFDKTGTLTEGNLEVARLKPAEGVELAELLQVATSTEYHSNHPAAAALKRLAKEAGIAWEDPDRYTEVAGKGVEATYAGSVCRVGRQSWLQECGLDTHAVSAGLEEDDTAGMSVVFVSCDERVLGWIGLRDAIRSVAKEAISQLRELGVGKCCMVTGDIERVAQLVGGKIGVTEIQASCLPQDKVTFVENLKAQGDLVAVVGDGVNDGPALAAGDIGIAMGAIGSDVAVQSASVALMNNDLRRIPFFISLARRTRLLMNQNLAIGLGFIVLGLYFSTLGYINAVVAAVLHSLGSLLILFNSARLVRTGEELQTQDSAAASRNVNG